MSITEARSFVGKRCEITWTDRSGQEFKNVGTVQQTRFVPMYGAYLITETDEVSLEKIKGIEPLE
jgi:hypothetical protein